MNRRRHQSDPNEGDSTESGDETFTTNRSCAHITRGVDLTKIRKVISKIGLLSTCEMCKDSVEPDLDMNGDFEFDNSLWMCLKCGYQGCGRQRNRHALAHYSTPHSDCHALCLNTENWRVWCYDCDDDVNVTSTKKLLEAVESIKRSQEKKNTAARVQAESPPSLEMVPYSPPNPETVDCDNTELSRPRGLMNLGNTCFFNSVVQCLVQTPFLLELLNETSSAGQLFRLPGGEIDSNIEVPPLEGVLDKWKPLTAILAETIMAVQSGGSSSYVPRILLSKLVQRMPQFGGGDQHDSHELLRHLLEAVREEDLRRYQSVILEKLGFNRKTDPATVEGDRKKVVKFYGQQASEMLLPTEQVFRGVLVSTLKCEDCNHTSLVEEYFLDLSLPIVEKSTPPILRRKADDEGESKSKHQMKKEKKAERKKRRQKGCHDSNKSEDVGMVNMSDGKVDDSPPNVADVDMLYSDSESDADVEDNVEVEVMKGIESGYNSEKLDNSSPDSNEQGVITAIGFEDSGIPSPSTGMVAMAMYASENCEANIDMGSLALTSGTSKNLSLTGNDEPSRPKSRLSFSSTNHPDLKTDLSKLHLHGNSAEQNDKSENNEAIKMDDDDNLTSWTSRMSAVDDFEDGEYSVQSCLNQFTAPELMAGSNKVSCEQCTTSMGGIASKKVYTNAIKQLLIYNPPAVLILHLKRFQVFRFRSTKVSKFVKFPMLLDLAPFCSKCSLNLPTVKNKSKILYSLYGVVEHSGSINGGHYVAYVKVRQKPNKTSSRWQFLPKNQQGTEFNSTDSDSDEVCPGKWYYISDSHVAEVPESRVLGAQAYLLFYERIL